MSDERLLPSGSALETDSHTTPSANGDVHRHRQGVVKRRSFLSGIGMTAAALSAGALLPAESRGQARSSSGKLSPGDAALLQFALWAELVESDLWTQYAELGGVGPSGGGAEPCSFINKNLPRCSVIRPTSTQLGGAVATVRAFFADGLFIGQPDEFFELSMRLAVATDSVVRGF